MSRLPDADTIDRAGALCGRRRPDTMTHWSMSGRTLTDFRTTGDLGPYRALLEDAVARECANVMCEPGPKNDRRDGVTPLYMPGTMADAYRAMGGEVVLYGKPGVAHFSAALRAAGRRRAGRALMVGDSLHHDILGAAAAGLDSLFVVDSGVHANDLAEVSGQCVERLAAAEGVPVPTFVMRGFDGNRISTLTRARPVSPKSRAAPAARTQKSSSRSAAFSHALGPKGQPRHGSVGTYAKPK